MARANVITLHNERFATEPFIEHFRLLIEQCDKTGGVAALLNSTDEERAALATILPEYVPAAERQLRMLGNDAWTNQALKRPVEPPGAGAGSKASLSFVGDLELGRQSVWNLIGRVAERVRLLTNCVFACGTLADAKLLPVDLNLTGGPQELEHLVSIVHRFRPVWFQEWHLYFGELAPGHYSLTSTFVSNNLCKPQDTPRYLLSVLSRSARGCPLNDVKDDKLFQEKQIWRYFEFEPPPASEMNQDTSLANADFLCTDRNGKIIIENTWWYAFKALSERGLVSRDRLLDATLEALSREFTRRNASWFIKFHEYMAPTLKELAVRQRAYFTLLGCRQHFTVNIALEAIERIDSDDSLDTQAFLAALGQVFVLRTKGTVVVATRFLEKIIARQPHEAALLTAAEGLATEFPEVQERLAEMLRKNRALFTDQVREMMVRSRELVQPSVRNVLNEMLAQSQHMLKVALASTVSRDDTIHPRLGAQASPLADQNIIVPIADPEELIERSAYLLEQELDIAELERVLDAIVRLAFSFRGQGAAALRLRKIAASLTARARKQREKSPPYMKGWVGELILACTAELSEHIPSLQLPAERRPPAIVAFCRNRLQAIHLRVTEAATPPHNAPLLSTPTHYGFWVDPLALVSRVDYFQKHGVTPEPHDTIIALLRIPSQKLNPSQHAVALENATHIPGEAGEALRYALGADAELREGAVHNFRTEWLWAAASRARYRGEADMVLAQRFPHLPPGAAVLPVTTWRPRAVRRVIRAKDGDSWAVHHRFLSRGQAPESPHVIDPLLFTSMLCSGEHCAPRDMMSFSPWVEQLLSYWPGWPDPTYSYGILSMGNSLDKRALDFEKDHSVLSYLAALAQPFEPFAANAMHLLNFGLSSPKADERAAAVTAFIAGVESGRLNGRALGESLSVFFGSGLIFPARIRKSLDVIVRVSDTHRRAVLSMLLALLERSSSAKEAPPETAVLLELLRELLVELKQCVTSSAAITYLKSFAGSNRAARISAAILKDSR